MHTILTVLSLLSFYASRVLGGLPPKIYGVNLGSWLVLEPWMLPGEWLAMGGEHCDCSSCIGSEFAFVEAYPDTADQIFDKHWSTWFTQDDVNQLCDVGINTVRIPLGYWLIEDLVDRNTEHYPRGGLNHLRRGLRMLHNAGISVILDHHALPGVQSPNQMFAGRCTSDVQFYTPENYQRALTWTAVMTSLSHMDADFSAVAALEAVNEPISDASRTPGYGDFQKNFVQTVRAVEEQVDTKMQPRNWKPSHSNFTQALEQASKSHKYNSDVRTALENAVPILLKLAAKHSIESIFDVARVKRSDGNRREPLVTNFMDILWQHNDPPNPAVAADGPQVYDDHMYYSFGGVTDANEDAYMSHICNLDRVGRDAAVGNSPMFFGEWALSTQFRASDSFLRKWADAQKMAYGKGAGWIFWNFKIEISDEAHDTARQWSYMEGVRRGYLTHDPSQFNNPHVCDEYID